MRVKVGIRIVAGCWLISLLPVTALAAATSDQRVVEAVKNRDKDAVVSLLKQHADVNAPQADGSTALAWAAHWNDLETADLLLGAGAKVNAANEYGVTPLALACSNANAAMVERLLKAGANPNAAQWSGETALMTCARTGSVEAVNSLLANKADVNAATRRGQTALMWAAAEKHPEVARALISHGADVNAQSHLPAEFKPAQYLTYGVHPKVPLKTDRFEPEDVHQDPLSSKGGFTALMFAAREGDLETARILIEAGAKLNVSTPDYGSALTMASASGHEALSLFLLEKGADPNVADGFGFFPLHYALQQGIRAIAMSRQSISSDHLWQHPNMPELLKALLAHGANPNARVAKGYPPFNYPAFSRTTGNAMPHLRQPGATAFLLAAAADDPVLMRLLADKGADPLLPTEEGTTPLMAAAGLGRLEDRTKEEEIRALEAVKLAMELGADVNAANKDGQTALHSAAYMGSNEIIQLLVDKGAKLNPADKYGETPLHIAEGNPAKVANARDKRYHVRAHKTTAELLLKLGATPLPARVRSADALFEDPAQ